MFVKRNFVARACS